MEDDKSYCGACTDEIQPDQESYYNEISEESFHSDCLSSEDKNSEYFVKETKN